MISKDLVLGRLYRRLRGKPFDLQSNTIHLVSTSFNTVPPDKYGGIELVVAYLAEGFAARGAAVRCYSPGTCGVARIEHHQTLPARATNAGGTIHVNSEQHLGQVATGLAKHVRAGDVVLFNHPDHYRFLKRRSGLWALSKASMYEVAHWLDAGLHEHLIYPSAALQDYLGKPGSVIPHGQRLIFAEAGAKRESFVFFAGRITKDKGVDITLQACKRLGVQLVLAGPLRDVEFAAPIIADPSVTYLGELSYEDLARYYARAGAFAYMSQYIEPFGLAVVEAMAGGAPVITTGFGGTGDTVVDGQTGFFCQTVEEIVSAYHRRGSISSTACIERAQLYSVDRMADAYLALFRDQ